MLRRTALFALSSLLLSGCVTYEVVERRVYHADGSYTRIYDPHQDGRRYEDRRYDDRYGPYDGRHDRYRDRRYEYDRYDGGWDNDPYDRWFYGWRGDGWRYGSGIAYDPWFGYGGSTVTIIYGNGWRGSRWGSSWHRPSFGPSWYGPSWYGSTWSSPWGWHRPWSGFGPSWGYGPGYGHGHVPSRPRPPSPDPIQPRAKPIARSVGPDVVLPVMSGPSIGGEPIRALPSQQRWEEPTTRVGTPAPDALPDPLPREKPGAAWIEPPREEPRFEEPRFEQRGEPRFEEPRFEQRSEPRFEQPRFEQRDEPRFEQPRFEQRDEPRFEQPRFEQRDEPRFEEPRFEAPRDEPRTEPVIREDVE
jgi:hypothetical protein